MSAKTPLSAFEKELATTVSQATFPVGSGSKRFIRDIYDGRIQQLTDKGRWYLAYVAHRFRRQYRLTQEQLAWVNERLSREASMKAAK